jgi:hypothetical protein
MTTSFLDSVWSQRGFEAFRTPEKKEMSIRGIGTIEKAMTFSKLTATRHEALLVESITWNQAFTFAGGCPQPDIWEFAERPGGTVIA